MVSGRPFTLGVVTREVSRRHQEENEDDKKGGTKGDGAKAADGAVGVAGTGRGDDYGGDEGGMLSGVPVERHFYICGVLECVEASVGT